MASCGIADLEGWHTDDTIPTCVGSTDYHGFERL